MSQFSGVFAPSVTPFDLQTGEVDHAWIRQHLHFLRRHDCDGVVPLGTNGEGPSLSLTERKVVIETVLEAAGGMAVLPGTGCANLPETVELTRFALEAGARAVLVIPAFYFKNITPEGLLAYYRRLCDKALQPGRQLYLYHFPKMSAVPISEAVVDGLQESHPGCVAGIKDSSGDLESIRRWRSHYPWLQVFAGSDYLASQAYQEQCTGTISAAANISPHLIQSVRAAVAAGQDPSPLQARLNQLRDLLSRFPMRAATKFLVSTVAQLPPVAVRPPLVELSDTQQAELAAQARQSF